MVEGVARGVCVHRREDRCRQDQGATSDSLFVPISLRSLSCAGADFVLLSIVRIFERKQFISAPTLTCVGADLFYLALSVFD